MKHSKRIGAVAVLSSALLLGGCNEKQETVITTTMVETTVESSQETQTMIQETTQSEPETTTTQEPEENESTEEHASMINPMKQVESSEDFKAINLSLYLPEDSAWCSDPVYYIIDKEVAHIKFYDTITESEAVVRAAKEELGDVSGVYYNFDDTKTIQWEAEVKAGEKIQIRVRPVVEGSDIPGVLAMWTYNGVNYTLWEDEGKNDPESVAKLAGEIAKQSAK